MKGNKHVKTITNITYAAFTCFALICVSHSYATPPDATLYTTYSTNIAQTTVSLEVCGSLPGSSGCYGGASLGPFGKVGALLEGEPTVSLNLNTVARAIYVVDIASGTNHNEVVLDVYRKVDTITTTFDTVTVTLSRTIRLPLVGGATVQTSMAANKLFLFIGTNRTTNAVEINKRSFSITQLGGFSPPINVSAITADKYGYVTLSFGSFRGFDNAFIVVDPNGSSVEDGGGSQLMLNTVQAVVPSTLH